MQNGLNRKLLLLAVFLTAFLAVIIIRKMQNGESILDIISGNSPTESTKNKNYTLQKKPSLEKKDIKTLIAFDRECATLVHAVIPSVVSINTNGIRNERRYDVWGRTWLQPRAVQSQGSGVIVTKEGHVLTNYHVIKGNPQIKITMHDGSVHPAKIIGADPTVDIAVIQILDKGPFKPLKFGDSSKLEVGNLVFAIGSPFGLGESVTNGIISAKKRSFSDTQVDLLQTSAAINPGNSGGPLINVQGEIIGINSRIYSSDKKNPGFQGISFAIPSNAAQKTLRRILNQGVLARGFLGMALADIDAFSRKELDYPYPTGVRILGLAPNGPAMQAGLHTNDVVIEFNKVKVTNSRQLIALIQQGKPKTKVPLTIWRDHKIINITATLGDADEFNQQILKLKEAKTRQSVNALNLIKSVGLTIRNPNAKEKIEGVRGVVIEQISPKSPLKGQVLMGDQIIELNGKIVIDARDFYTRFVKSLTFKTTELSIIRGDIVVKLTIAPTK